ncbi:hypothetical protein LJC43_01250 [Parabacteroides sp. OttesenSCG-928-G21]|nr:hypothetical protein [Parabacteroides sp. OttesenSCG-928-G21]
MKKKNVLYFLPIILCVIFFASCDKLDDKVIIGGTEDYKKIDPDDEKATEDLTPLLPSLIKVKSIEENDLYSEYLYTIDFEYDEMNRPLKMQYIKERKNLETGVRTMIHKNNVSYTYNDEPIIKKESDIYELIYGYLYHYTGKREYAIEENDESVINVLVDESYSEKIKQHAGNVIYYYGLDVSYSPNLQVIENLQKYYCDSEWNIKEYNYITEDFFSARQLRTDGYNGIFKHVNLPAWFMISQWNYEFIGLEHLFNNAREIWMYDLYRDRYVPFLVNDYKYNSHGYPIEKTDWYESGWGESTSTMTIEYIEANKI